MTWKPYPESEYCTFLWEDGRQCRALKMPTRDVCIAHWRKDGEFNEDEAATAELARRADSLYTTRGINRTLACLFKLTAQGKIPHRKAALLSYQLQLALCTLGRPNYRETHPPAELLDATEREALAPERSEPSSLIAGESADSTERPAALTDQVTLSGVEGRAKPNGAPHSPTGSGNAHPEESVAP